MLQAEANIQREAISSKGAANQAHHDMSTAVRQFIAGQGGTMAENLPTPTKSIQELKRAEESGSRPSGSRRCFQR